LLKQIDNSKTTSNKEVMPENSIVYAVTGEAFPLVIMYDTRNHSEEPEEITGALFISPKYKTQVIWIWTDRPSLYHS
jgi:hypothetical protein